MSAQLSKLTASPDLVDQVHLALLDAISSGVLAPGQRVTQEDLARQFAVSRQPVLQALRLLRKDGLLREAPGRGLQVAPLDAGSIAGIYQVREALDVLAARLAAQQHQVIDPGLLATGRAATQGSDLGAMIDADLAFHNAVYAASGNPLIAPSAAVHWWHIRRAMGLSLQRAAIRDTVWDEHAAIAAAIASGDADLAASLIAAHARGASAHMCRRLNDAEAGTTAGTAAVTARVPPPIVAAAAVTTAATAAAAATITPA
jgi:DNA-binding GntR family transcriptional regulator